MSGSGGASSTSATPSPSATSTSASAARGASSAAHPKGEVEFYGVYREIAPPDRLVFTEIYKPFPHVESVVTTVFTEERGKTRMTVTALYPSNDVRDMVLQSGMEHGAAISYDRLEEVAAALQA